MISECTRLRLSGDWKSACAAAHIDVDIDLRDVASRHGIDEARRIEEDLRGLAPDLLRWHAPREYGGEPGLANGLLVLSRLDGPIADRLFVVAEPAEKQRMTLRVTTRAHLANRAWTDLPSCLWYAGDVTQARAAYGGDATRMPGFTEDGKPLRASNFAHDPQSANAPERAEALLRLLAEERFGEGWALAGLTLPEPDPHLSRWTPQDMLRHLSLMPVNLPGLAMEIRRLLKRYDARVLIGSQYTWGMEVYEDKRGHLQGLQQGKASGETIRITQQVWSIYPDLPLVWKGRMNLADMHPLMRQAFFPAAEPAAKEETKVRVRCGREWRTVAIGPDELEIEHTPDELRRELAIGSLGGTPCRCAQAHQAWRQGRGWLPRELRARRTRFFDMARHGYTAELLSILDSGYFRHLRDSNGRTLLFYLHHLDHEVALPKLLEYGLSLDDADANGQTPLHHIAYQQLPELVAALLKAGADRNRRDGNGHRPAELLRYRRQNASRSEVLRLLES